MTELEKAEQEIAAARVAERVAEWKAMEAKASYYRYASEAMAASAEVMGARIRRDSAQASEWADAVLAKGEPLLDPVPSPSPESSSQETVTDETPIIETQSEHRGEKIMWAPRLIPDDFIAWDGGLPPAELTAKVDVIDRQGWKWRGWLVGQMNWGHSGSNGDIVAYRLAKSPTDDERTSVVTDHDRVEPEDLPKLSDSDFQALPKFKEGERETVTEAADPFDPTDADFASFDDDDEESPDDEDEEEREEVAAIITAIPDGMTPWASGDCPVPAETLVEAVYADHQGNDNRFHLGDGPAGGMNWNGKMTNNEGNPQSPVIAYRVIEAPAETPQAPSEPQSQSEGAGERVEQTENPAAQMFGKALAAESEAKEQRKYNPFAIFGAKVDA